MKQAERSLSELHIVKIVTICNRYLRPIVFVVEMWHAHSTQKNMTIAELEEALDIAKKEIRPTRWLTGWKPYLNS